MNREILAEIYATYKVADSLEMYEDCSPKGFYERWKNKNRFLKEHA